MIGTEKRFARGSIRVATLMLLVLAFVMGCSAPAPCVVTGVVKVNQTPTKGIYVVLHSAAGETAGSGRTNDDGTFRLTVKQTGAYAITCLYPQVTIVMDDTFEGEDQFNGRYNDWRSPVATANVTPGETSLPTIELQR